MKTSLYMMRHLLIKNQAVRSYLTSQYDGNVMALLTKRNAPMLRRLFGRLLREFRYSTSVKHCDGSWFRNVGSSSAPIFIESVTTSR